MRSSDETHYNIKRLHVVFAISSLALLCVTVWMLAADHCRRWKVYQRNFQDRIEPWFTQSRIRQQQSRDFAAREKELSADLARARSAVPDRFLIERFCRLIVQQAGKGGESVEAARIIAAYEELAASPSRQGRGALVDRLSKRVTAAENRQEKIDRSLRFARADFDEARSFYEAAVGEGASRKKLDRMQARVDAARATVAELSSESEEVSKYYRSLVEIAGEVSRREDAARLALADHRAVLDQLERTLAQQELNPGKRLLRLPIIDAFGRPLSVDQIWLPELTIDYNFRKVARFDRCMTCHQGIDHTEPGSAVKPAYRQQRVLTIRLAGIGQVDHSRDNHGEQDPLLSRYGFALANSGILEADAVTISLVLPSSAASEAGLQPGDVIQKIDGTEVERRRHAVELLAAEDHKQEPVELEIRRGLPHPYSSHPRLDLFVGSLSPHPVSEFGCTICHDGQGSATEFKWASHTPDDPTQRTRWRHEHGWFQNPHWDFPMRPGRFSQSSCLRCHHDVLALEPSQRFPEPPAPKLVAGYDLIRRSGCFGCHEIRGATADGQAVGPDLLLEPDYHEAALRLLSDPGLAEHDRLSARRVVARPEDPQPRRQLVVSLQSDVPVVTPDKLPLRPESYAMLELLADEPAPGGMHKVGPGLHDVSDRLGIEVLVDKIRDPARFRLRPDTQMPGFFGLHDHLDGRGLTDAERFEAVEIRAVAEYLLAAGRPTQSLDPPPGVTERASPEEGGRQLEIQGCLACHKHRDFPQHESTQGPDLSDVYAKYTASNGFRWLASWIRDPVAHSRRTTMPNVQLEPTGLVVDQIAEERAGEGRGAAEENADQDVPMRMRDPAADVAAYLLLLPPESDQSSDSKSIDIPPLSELVDSDLDELIALHLSKTFSSNLAREYLDRGIPASMAAQVSGDTVELLGKMTRAKKLRYLGRRTIRKRGCYGCHDVPGFEDAQPIGPAFSDWGRKQQSLLAFERVNAYVSQSHSESDGKSHPKPEDAENAAGEDADRRAFFIEALQARRREGFLWQKLREPRSFDYKKASNKEFNECLTMGQFSFDDAQIEAIATFVLGLVAEPPADKYMHGEPDPRHRSIVGGRRLFQENACTVCHTMEMARWAVTFDIEEPEGFFEDLNLPLPVEDFQFLHRNLGDEAIEALEDALDEGGIYRSELVGMPKLDRNGQLKAEEYEDYDGNPFDLYSFSLWEPALLEDAAATAQYCWGVKGQVRYLLKPNDTLKEYRIEETPPVGGEFSRLLYPLALAEARRSGAIVSSTDEDQAWGWVPPPLINEGAKVRAGWLAEYLSNPYSIRPAALLRMPKYNFSVSQAGMLADYLVAATGGSLDVASPAVGPPTPAEQERKRRIESALKIIEQRNVDCTSCHRIGDYTPGEDVKATLAPNLEQVDSRLQPDYLRRWLANPKAVLPYTRMTRNFDPMQPPLGQETFPVPAIQQLDAVTDLLLNYHWYMGRRFGMQERE